MSADQISIVSSLRSVSHPQRPLSTPIKPSQKAPSLSGAVGHKNDEEGLEKKLSNPPSVASIAVSTTTKLREQIKRLEMELEQERRERDAAALQIRQTQKELDMLEKVLKVTK